MRKSTKRGRLPQVYESLLGEYGRLGWWPAKTPFEVIVGAILTQNTSWSNVEKAIGNLKAESLLSPDAMRAVPAEKLGEMIKPSGYFNLKAEKINAFMEFFFKEFGGDMELMRGGDTRKLRSMLLSVWGVGPETADSILLYALDKPSFVVDAYTRRIFSRLGLLEEDSSYDEIKAFFEGNLSKNVGLYNEYHALIVEHAKRVCLKNTPRCGVCCLRKQCRIKSSPKAQTPLKGLS